MELEGLERAIFNKGDFVLGVFPIAEDLLASSISLGAGLEFRDSCDFTNCCFEAACFPPSFGFETFN